MPRRSCTVLLVLFLSGCDGMPWFRVPQVEQAGEAVHDSGERLRAHHTCSDGARSVDELIACMREARWEFVASGTGYPEADCWQARTRGELERLAPFCFVRSAGHERGVTPEPPPAGR